MTETKYTLEQFEIDMENASPEKKSELIEKAVDTLDIDPTDKDTILKKHREDLEDLKLQLEIEDNERCIKEIENGKLGTYTCIKDYTPANASAGQNYFVKIDAVSTELKEKFSGLESPAMTIIMERINGMKDLTYIYSDGGIGTLKKKYLFNNKYGDFSEYFENNQK